MSKSCVKDCALPKSFFPVKFRVRSPLEALKLARKLIRPFEHWTTGDLAVGKVEASSFGVTSRWVVDVKSPKAEAFCALGALQRVNTQHQGVAQEFLERAAAKLRRPDGDLEEYLPVEDDIFDLNDASHDKRNHARVLKMFDKAIGMARRAQKSRKR